MVQFALFSLAGVVWCHPGVSILWNFKGVDEVFVCNFESFFLRRIRTSSLNALSDSEQYGFATGSLFGKRWLVWNVFVSVISSCIQCPDLPVQTAINLQYKRSDWFRFMVAARRLARPGPPRTVSFFKIVLILFIDLRRGLKCVSAATAVGDCQ